MKYSKLLKLQENIRSIWQNAWQWYDVFRHDIEDIIRDV